MISWLEQYRPKRFKEFYYSTRVKPLRSVVAMLRSRRFQNLLFSSKGYGYGKTSLARAMGSRVQCLRYNEHEFEPCGSCQMCRIAQVGKSDVVWTRYHEVSACDGNIKSLVDQRFDLFAMGSQGSPGMEPNLPFILAIDEFQLLSLPEQASLLKRCEDEANVCVVLLTSDGTKIDGGIRSRTLQLDFRPPTFEEYVPWISRILAAEKISYESGVLELLFHDNHGQPREILKCGQQWAWESRHWRVKDLQQLADADDPPSDRDDY
jgi:DNA polymerase III gamma/tau subunit